MSDDLDYEKDLEDENSYEETLDYCEVEDPTSYDESSDYEPESGYGSRLKSSLAKYQTELSTAAGGAAGGALMFGTPEAAAFAGLVMGTAYVGGKASAKGLDSVRKYLGGEKEKEDTETDESYSV